MIVATYKQVQAYVTFEMIDGGVGVLTLNNPRTNCPMAMFRFEPGSAAVIDRCLEAWLLGTGDADAYFEATGISDAEAFNAKTWR